MKVNRIARCLIHFPELVIEMPFEVEEKGLCVYTDSDWASCMREVLDLGGEGGGGRC